MRALVRASVRASVRAVLCCGIAATSACSDARGVAAGPDAPGGPTAPVTPISDPGPAGPSAPRFALSPNMPPLAAFSMVTAGPIAKSPTRFDASASTGTDASATPNLTSWTFDYGDGTGRQTFTTAYAVHAYAAPGTYTARLIVQNALGAKDSTTLAVMIAKRDTLAITYAPATPGAGEAAVYTTANANSPSGNAGTFLWTFTGFAANGTGQGTSASFAFDSAGTRLVKLVGQYPGGPRQIVVQTVTVGAAKSPTGGIACTPASPTAGQTVTCASSVQPVSGAVANYAWTFPSGSPASTTGAAAASASTQWAAAGTYTVSLTATNTYGKSASFTQALTVAAAASTVLFRYVPGATGNPTPTFTRALAATYIGSDSMLGSVGANVMRDGFALPDGTQTLLLEPARTNQWTYSELLTNAAWTASRVTVTCTGTQSPLAGGAANVCTLVPTTQNQAHTFSRTATIAGGSTSFIGPSSALSFFARQAGYRYLGVYWQDGGGVTTSAVLDLGTAAAPACAWVTFGLDYDVELRRMKNGWCHVVVGVSGGTGTASGKATFYPSPTTAVGGSFAGNGTSGVQLWGMQFERDVAIGSSYIPTTAAAVTRPADATAYPISFALQPLTMLASVADPYGGTKAWLNKSYDLIAIGAGALAGASGNTHTVVSSFQGYSATPGMAIHADGSTSASADGGGGTLGSREDVWLQLNADGSVQADARPAGTSGTPGAASGALAMQGSWSSPTVYFGAVNNGQPYGQASGPVAVRKVVIATGAVSLDAMRAK